MYMRVWHRIANDPRYTRTKWSDLQIRTTLCVPSIDIVVCQRRLKYLARLASCSIEPLLASLQSTTQKGEKMLWLTLIENDVKIFLEAPNVAENSRS